MKKLAYFTCFFGSENNYSFMIPPLPSEKNDCYFFTNNPIIYGKLENTLWIRIWLDIPIHNSHILDTMESKEIRCCSHRFPQLTGYEYLCWLDSKIQIYENKVDEIVNEMDLNGKTIALTKHPYSDRFHSVWDEYNLAIGVEKYGKQKEQYKKYIEKQLSFGFSEKINIHYGCTFRLFKCCDKTREIGELWFKHIQECGIEDQISFQFIRQIYDDEIMALEYQETWKYSFE
jgi:hypothetical protein